MKLSIVVVGLLLVANGRALASDRVKTGDTTFTAYEGKQDWPKGENAEVIKDYAVPIYVGLPAKSYTVLGRISDKRTDGIEVVGRAFDEGLGKEDHRMRNVANRAKLQNADAVIVTDDEKVLAAFKLSKKEIEEGAPLFKHKHKIVLAIKFE